MTVSISVKITTDRGSLTINREIPAVGDIESDPMDDIRRAAAELETIAADLGRAYLEPTPVTPTGKPLW